MICIADLFLTLFSMSHDYHSVTLHVHGNHANATKNVTMRRVPSSLYSHGINATLSKVFTGSETVLGKIASMMVTMLMKLRLMMMMMMTTAVMTMTIMTMTMTMTMLFVTKMKMMIYSDGNGD